MSRLWVLPVFLVVVLVFAPGMRGSAQGPAGASPAVAEELIVEKDAGALVLDEEDAASPDGGKAAWRTPRAKKWAVMLNGQQQAGLYDEVRALTFSPDGARFAFLARSGKAWTLVLDGQEAQQRYEKVGSLAFSRDGQRTIFPAKRAGGWTAVADGQEVGGTFDTVDGAIFSPDGRRIAIAGRRDGKCVAVVDGKAGAPFDVLGGGAFSADSRRFGYAGVEVHRGLGGNKARGRVVVDGEPGPQFEGNTVGSWRQNMAAGQRLEIAKGYQISLDTNIHGVTVPSLSPDGSRVAYAAHVDKEHDAVVLDGKTGPQFDAIADGPVFSNDGRHVAYIASDLGAAILVVDGNPVAKHVSMERVGDKIVLGGGFFIQTTFAPDNQRVGYVRATNAQSENGKELRASYQLFVDGVEGPEYEARTLLGPMFSPDSQHVAYVVAGQKRGTLDVSFVVSDGMEGTRYDAVHAGSVRVLDTGIATYTARAGRKFLRVTQSPK